MSNASTIHSNNINLCVQHCKPAVDEEKFQKMVERQYELMKAERMRQLEEPSAAAKTAATPVPTQRADETDPSATGGAASAAPATTASGSGATAAEQQSTGDQEVSVPCLTAYAMCIEITADQYSFIQVESFGYIQNAFTKESIER